MGRLALGGIGVRNGEPVFHRGGTSHPRPGSLLGTACNGEESEGDKEGTHDAVIGTCRPQTPGNRYRRRTGLVTFTNCHSGWPDTCIVPVKRFPSSTTG